MPKTINVKVPREGISTGKAHVEIESDGFRGESCKNATKAFEQCLAATVVDDTAKQEMYEPDEQVEWTQEGGGG